MPISSREYDTYRETVKVPKGFDHGQTQAGGDPEEGETGRKTRRPPHRKARPGWGTEEGRSGQAKARSRGGEASRHIARTETEHPSTCRGAEIPDGDDETVRTATDPR
jgi:hypothetical protein